MTSWRSCGPYLILALYVGLLLPQRPLASAGADVAALVSVLVIGRAWGRRADELDADRREDAEGEIRLAQELRDWDEKKRRLRQRRA